MDNLESNGIDDSIHGIKVCEEFKSLTNTNKMNLSFSDVTYTVRKHLLTTSKFYFQINFQKLRVKSTVIRHSNLETC